MNRGMEMNTEERGAKRTVKDWSLELRENSMFFQLFVEETHAFL